MIEMTEPGIQVRPVAGKSMLDTFIRVPWSVYANDPCWVPPLMTERRDALSDRNPFFQHAAWNAWIAYQDGKPVGRISAQVDQLFLRHQDSETGFFGLLEGHNNPAIFNALLGAAEDWLLRQGMKQALGPFNLGVNQEIGLLVDGFDSPPYVMMGHARPYYEQFITKQGYQPRQDLLAYELGADDFAIPAVMKSLLKRQKHRVRTRRLDRGNRVADLNTMREVFNDAWSNNWGFVPFTEAEFQAVGKELLMIVPADYINIAEVDGEPAAFIVMLPNINEAIADLDGALLPFGWARLLWRLKSPLSSKKPKSARVALMGVKQKFQHTRLGPALAFLLIDQLEKPGKARGLERIELSWILESNQGIRNVIEQVGGVVTKRYRMYGKALARSPVAGPESPTSQSSGEFSGNLPPDPAAEQVR